MGETTPEKERIIRELVRAVTGVAPGDAEPFHGTENGTYAEVVQHDEIPDVNVWIWNTDRDGRDGLQDPDQEGLCILLGCAEMENFGDMTSEVKAAFRTVISYMDEARARQKANWSPDRERVSVPRFAVQRMENGVRAWIATCNRDILAGIGEMDGKVKAISLDPDKAWAWIINHLRASVSSTRGGHEHVSAGN